MISKASANREPRWSNGSPNALNSASFRPAVAAVEEVVAQPDRVESDFLRRPGQDHVFRPPHLPFDLRQLHSHAKRPHAAGV